MAHSVVEFEATKRKEFRLEEFYKQFKTCLPKMVMVSQGFRGTSSEDTFELGEVIVIIGKAKDVFHTERKAIKECIEGRYIIEEQHDEEYETSVVRERRLKFISLVRESIKNLEERFTETLHSPLPAKPKISRKSPTLNAPKNIRALSLNEEPQATETANHKNVTVQNHMYENDEFCSKMCTEEEGSDPINLSLPIVEVKRLSMEGVGKYLKLLNLAMYVDIFRENLIDGLLLLSLDEELLTTDLKMNDEEARKLIQFAKTGEMPHS